MVDNRRRSKYSLKAVCSKQTKELYSCIKNLATTIGVFLVLSLTVLGQADDVLLGLKAQLKKAHHDTATVRILSDIVDNTYDYTVWPEYNNQMLEIAQFNLPNDNPALDSLFKKFKAYGLNNKGMEVEYEGNRILALEYYQQSLSIHKSIDWKMGMSSSLNNIGSLLSDQGEVETALEYYNESIRIKKELGLKSALAWTYMNVGSLEEKLNRYNEALTYYEMAYGIHKDVGNIYGIGAVAHNIGTVLKFKSGNVELGLAKFRESLRCYTQVADSTGISWEMGVIGLELFKLNKLDSALWYIHNGLRMARNNNYQEGILSCANHLVEVYRSVNDFKNAFKYQLVSIEMEEAIQGAKIQQEIIKKEMQFVHNQEKLEIEKEQEKKELITQAKHQQQQIIIGSGIGVLVVVMIFLGLLYQRFKKEKEQRVQIKKQHDQIEEKNAEIIDSITYAERIQRAILKSEEYTSGHLPEHFILFKPKDIVSGDFYWAHERDNTLYLSVADCTGHGVPGALMSMLGISLLNDIVTDNPEISPSSLLGNLRERVINELSQTGHEDDSKDGMDISLVKLNMQTKEIEWAGANNPMWIVRGGSEEIEEIKPDKEPIAHYMNMTPYTNHTLQLNTGDIFYLFSDGYADQFGGDLGKKLKYGPFKKLLIQNSKEKMAQQKLLLAKFMENWQGEIGQIDDICVLGMKI